MHFPQVKNRPR